MRLICPNCGAQYEVPPEAIPPAGRDVQCSACGRTWFEKPPEGPAGPEPWDLVPRVIDDEEEADDLVETQVAPPPTPTPSASASSSSAPLSSVPPAAPRSTVTPEVAGILRAEAEREAQTRAQEAAARFVPPAEPAATAPEPLRSEPSSPAPVPEPPRAATRPSRSPDQGIDLDRINSSLRTANNRIAGKPPQVGRPRRRGGFAGGFWGAILVLAVLAGLYVAGPAIVAAAPQTGVVLNPYIATVNSGRAWLDRQVGVLLAGEAAATQ